MIFAILFLSALSISFSEAFHIIPKSFLPTSSNLKNTFIGYAKLKAEKERPLCCLHMASKSICSFDNDDFALPSGEWPYTDADMGRLDSSNDSSFYDTPRLVTHIDDRAIESLTKYYREEMTQYLTKNPETKKLDILDLCSSWISHYPTDMQDKFELVVGIGMNEEELSQNEQLYMHYRQDLNKNPSLSQFEDNSFDFVTNVVSVDYLTQPKEVFEEIHRILRPGGIALMSFSNRCFASKAVAMWLQADDIGRMTIVGSYFHYSAVWSEIEALYVTEQPGQAPKRPSFGELFKNPSAGLAYATTMSTMVNTGDPLFMVKAMK